PIHDTTGVVVGASKIARDITRQKEDAELIQQYARRLELINNVGRSINSELEMDAILQKVTDATTQLSGAAFGAFFYNKTNAAGNSYMLYTLSGVPKSAFENFPMPRNTDVFGPTFSGEGVVRSADITKDPRYGHNAPHQGMPNGHLPVVSYLAVPVKSASGIVIGGLFFGHPMPNMFTEDHEHLVGAIASHAATTLDNAMLYEEVNALNRKKDDFIAAASHELKTPLTTISGYMQLAESVGHMTPEIIQRINNQLQRLTRIIDDFLDISRIHGGRLKVDKKTAVIQQIVQRSADAIAGIDSRIRFILPPDPISIMVDTLKMEQVIINLLTNAVKYSSPGSPITLEVSILGKELRIAVKDEGKGIAPHDLDRIFHQFYRASAEEREQGLGLGLYIAKEIINLHFGKIWADSTLGKGSTFYVQIPIDSGR
ncbi:MAG: GAF domain-containing sensor histidine kinase, partial [Chitinophagaceae bacterium]|nr:GAF domain-containing sensor histidine kinase [Chitinophagaceae bacterium]